MKTQKEIEGVLYKTYFTKRRKAKILFHGLGITFIIGLIIDIVGRLTHQEDHFDVTLSAIGLLSLLCFIIMIIYDLFTSPEYEIKSQKEKLQKSIDELNLRKNVLTNAVAEEYKKISDDDGYHDTQERLSALKLNLDNELQISQLQENIWELEFKLKMLGD